MFTCGIYHVTLSLNSCYQMQTWSLIGWYQEQTLSLIGRYQVHTLSLIGCQVKSLFLRCAQQLDSNSPVFLILFHFVWLNWLTTPGQCSSSQIICLLCSLQLFSFTSLAVSTSLKMARTFSLDRSGRASSYSSMVDGFEFDVYTMFLEAQPLNTWCCLSACLSVLQLAYKDDIHCACHLTI